MTAMTREGADRGVDRRNRNFGIFLLGLAAIVLAVFATGATGLDATFRFDDALGDPTFVELAPLTVPVAPAAVVLGLLIAAIGAYQIARGFGDRATVVVSVGTGLFVLAFLTWAARDGQLPMVALFKGTVRFAVPLAFGALSGLLCERAGVINIAIEAQFLTGAFVAAVVASVAGNPWAGMLGALVAAGLIGALLAVLSIRYRADQIVVGVVLIVLATGLTSFLTSQILARNADLNTPVRFNPIDIPVLADIPILGPLLFRQSVVVYLMFIAVAVTHWALFNTRWGLRHRSVGEHPRAADTVGINVLATRYRAVILGGVVAGFGGAYFTLDAVGQFSREMTGGRGFIALAAMLVGRYNPVGALGAALVFGFADALATRLQLLDVGIPSSLLLTTPFVVTILVVAGLVGRVRMPAADGQPYVKEG